MNRYDWKRLSKLQLGKYAEYFAKMEFTLFGFSVYTVEVDNRGIDCVVQNARGDLFEVQVKSVRQFQDVFIKKATFAMATHRVVVLVFFCAGQAPDLYLIPLRDWQAPKDGMDKLLKSRDYVGKKSEPEWVLSLTASTLPLLDRFRFDASIVLLSDSQSLSPAV